MAPDKPKAKRGRPPKSFARTPEEYDEIIFKVANSAMLIPTADGTSEKNLFEINLMKISSEKPSVRLGAKAFLDVVQAAAKREGNRRSHRASIERQKRITGL